MMKIDEHLAASIDWAEERLRSGAEPPWTYYRLMQLKEAALELMAGLQSVSPTDHSQRSEAPEDDARPHGANIDRIDVARRRRDTEKPLLPT